MFIMGSSSPGRVAPRADRCLGGQFVCAPMSYLMFSTIVDVTNGCWGVFVGCVFGDEKGFHVGFNIKLAYGNVLPSTTAHNHGISDMTTSWSLMSLYSHHRPPFRLSKGTLSIYTSWATPLCLGKVQFLQLAAKEHKRRRAVRRRRRVAQ